MHTRCRRNPERLPQQHIVFGSTLLVVLFQGRSAIARYISSIELAIEEGLSFFWLAAINFVLLLTWLCMYDHPAVTCAT